MRLSRSLWVCLIVALTGMLALSAGLLAADATTLPANLAASKDPAQLRQSGFNLLLGGDFQDGATLLAKADKLTPDRDAAAAVSLTGDYLKIRTDADGERNEELAGAIARVKLASLAEKQRPLFEQNKLGEKLFAKIEEIADPVAAAEKLLEINSASQPADIRKSAAVHVAKAVNEIAEAEKLMAEDKGEWANAFRASTARLRQVVEVYRAGWDNATLPADWRRIKALSEKVQDALMDVGVLVSREPLMVALSHAREAKELFDDNDKFLQQPWVTELIAAARQRGEELMKQGKWNEAMAIYGHSGLSELDSANTSYEDTLKLITLHVRAVNLYGHNGNGKDKNGASKPAKPDGQPPDEPRWREMISGIDTQMVREAIAHVEDDYVDRPDYRKLESAGINAIRVLAETSQAASSFPSLKDEKKRSLFVSGLNKLSEQLKRLHDVDHMELALALNRILELSSDTVDLPPEVINMEFAEGMLAELDQFSSMIWPYEEEDFRKRTMGSFYGIGVQIRKDPGASIEVVTPLPDTPAHRAGILAGDRIQAVDGRKTDAMSVEQTVKMIQGPKKTKVTLTIKRAGRPKSFDVIVERDEIHIQTIKGWQRLADGKWDYWIDPANKIGFVRMTQFTQDTTEEFRSALRTLREGGATGVILDLRFNPGGLLTTAVDTGDEFLTHGVIVSTKSKRGNMAVDPPKVATPQGEFQEGKVIVLVNQYSASAAEILAGALKDWKRATIIGQRSYGKGSVQRLIPLEVDSRSGRPGKAKLKLTTAYYYLPQGRCLHRTPGATDWGVDPDISVPVTIRQMTRWSEIRQETDLLKNVAPAMLKTLLDQQLKEDIQLETSLLMLKLQLLAQK